MKFWRVVIFIIFVAALPVGLAQAGTEQPSLSDADLQKAEKLYSQIRCVVCEGQSLAGSQSQIAIAMRRQIMAAIKRGQSEEQILREMRQRYGDKILLSPPYQQNTYLLWLGPFALLIIAGLWVMRFFRRPAAEQAQTGEQAE